MGETIILPGAAASGRITPASFPFYTTGEDNLRVVSYNSAAGVSLKINGRLIDGRGKANADSWDHTPNTDRSAKTTDIALSGSTLLNLCVFAGTGSPLLGQTFVIVQLIRGLGAGAIVLGTILQGYVTGPLALGWPGSPIANTADVDGYTRTIAGTTPALGAEISETVPTGAIWELVSFNFVYTSGASGAARLVRLTVTVAGSLAVDVAAIAAQNVSTVGNYAWANQLVQQQVALAVGLFFSSPLPMGVMVPSGAVIGTITTNLNPSDQYSGVSYNVCERLLS